MRDVQALVTPDERRGSSRSRRRGLPVLAGALLLLASCAHPPAHPPVHPAAHSPAHHVQAPPEDSRHTVEFPAMLKEHTLANMRDHLLALQQIQHALSEQAYDRAADIAERRLGMSSLPLHGAHEVARFMPKGMQDAGTAMHRSASRFAIASRDAGASGDLRPALGALSEVTATCVACHAGYRLK
jgi:hypothetical protein